LPQESSTRETASPPIHQEGRFRRLWTVGLLSSLIRWIDVLSFSVVTYQQTHSAFWVASMMMLRMVPLALFGIAFGAIAARISRRTGLLVCQGVLMATTLALLAASTWGVLQVWHLAVAAFISGVVWAGDMPMRRGFIGDVVGAPRMSQAMALDAVANNGSRLAGPAVGGLLLASGGMTAVLVVDAVLYVLVLAALLGLPKPVAPKTAGSPRVGWSRLLDGLRAARESPRLTAILCNTIIFNIFCWPMVSMIPVIAQEQLQLGTEATGLLASMDGLGALLGAVLLTSMAQRLRHGPVYIGGTILFLVMLPLFALSGQPLLAALFLVGLGAGQGAFAVMQSTLVFLVAPAERRLEAMGLMTTCIGVAPLGFVFVGWLAERFGASGAAIVCSGSGLLTLALTWSVWKPCLRD
jgi:MFS family permease